MRYVQHSALGGKGVGITVTAYAAGHMLGGAVWKVHKEAEDVVYAVDYNHRKEKHLNGTALESINRPSLLITDAFNARGRGPTVHVSLVYSPLDSTGGAQLRYPNTLGVYPKGQTLIG